MAISTYKTFLMYKASASADYTKLIDIKEYPDLGGDPENLETTTLSDKMRTYISGILDVGDSMSFTCNYTLADYQTVLALVGTEQELAVWFGGTESNGVVTPTGSEGKFKFTGQLNVYVNGGGVNEVVNMTVSVAPTSVISLDA